jgi:hypothetical protein
MLFTGLEHTAIASPHPKDLADWYVANLGFVINYEYAGNYFVKAPNGAMLEIIPSEGPAAETAMKTPGIRHLAVMVSDFDAAHRRDALIAIVPVNSSASAPVSAIVDWQSRVQENQSTTVSR